jgi:hypothetical protein
MEIKIGSLTFNKMKELSATELEDARMDRISWSGDTEEIIEVPDEEPKENEFVK